MNNLKSITIKRISTTHDFHLFFKSSLKTVYSYSNKCASIIATSKYSTLQCQFNANLMPIQCQFNANLIPIQFQFNASSMPIEPFCYILHMFST